MGKAPLPSFPYLGWSDGQGRGKIERKKKIELLEAGKVYTKKKAIWTGRG